MKKHVLLGFSASNESLLTPGDDCCVEGYVFSSTDATVIERISASRRSHLSTFFTLAETRYSTRHNFEYDGEIEPNQLSTHDMEAVSMFVTDLWTSRTISWNARNALIGILNKLVENPHQYLTIKIVETHYE